MTEQWRAAPGYEGLYEVSDLGRIRSLDRMVMTCGGGHRLARGVLMNPRKRHNNDDRYQAHLSSAGKRRTYFVHRLVLLAFTGEPQPGQEACHWNGDASDNRLANLRWDSHAANMADMKRHGTMWQLNVTQCPAGHKYTPENTYTFPNGKRTCQECQRAHGRRQTLARRNQKAGTH